MLAKVNPETKPPANNPTTPATPRKIPARIGTAIAIKAGTSISLCAPRVDISTHFAYSGVAFPSKIPGISLN